MDDPRDGIIQSISMNKSRIVLRPHLTFLCGGEVDVKRTQNHSARNVFMNKTGSYSDEHIKFILAENYKDWKDSYTCLSEFENDIAHLSSKVVIIPETAGSLTELGLFFGNETLREKLTIIINNKHHESPSFIKFGILNSLEGKNQASVLAYDIDYDDIENVNVSKEIEEAIKEVVDSCECLDKTVSFATDNRGHILFLIFQIIDLFHAITITEISKYISILGINYDKRKITASLYILQKFDLISCKKRGATYFYFSNPTAGIRVEIKNKESKNFDYSAKKIEVFGYYMAQRSIDKNFRNRINIIESIRGDQ